MSALAALIDGDPETPGVVDGSHGRARKDTVAVASGAPLVFFLHSDYGTDSGGECLTLGAPP